MGEASNQPRRRAGIWSTDWLTRALSVANARLKAALGSPHKVISRLGIITTCITVFGPPLAVAILGAYHLQQRASEQAAIGARHLELQLTRDNSEDWLTQASISVLQATQANDAVMAGWVTDMDGNTLTFQGRKAFWPEVRGSEKVVTPPFKGYFHVAVSSREVFISTLHVLAIFMIAGLAAHYCFRRLPLAAIDNAEQLLEGKQRELLDQKSQLEIQNLRFDTALNHMSQALCMFDAEQRLVVCNARYSELYGLTADQVKAGTTLRQILEYRIAQGLLGDECPHEYMRQRLAVAERNHASIDIRELADGRTLLTKHQPMPNGGWVATIEDITEQRRLQAQVARLAHHDALTELPNRSFLRERLDSLLQARRRDEQIAVFCLDVDRFKDVNDTLGHPVGDALLHAVAKRLLDCIGKSDIVARIGADEFCIVQAGGMQPIAATRLADRILERLEAPFDFGKHQINIGASIGISLAPDNGTSYDDLFKNANLALYRAKSEGRGSYRFFEPEMDAKMQARSRLQMDLRRALGNGEFKLHYQPVMNLARNEICGLEALLRWQRADGSSISPAVFIPLAEETGLIVPIGEWVLRQACADAATWPEHIKVAVNLSAVQFKSRRLVETIVSALATSGLPAHRLELEITESVLLQSDEATLATLHQLRLLGVRIAMDDFGTGYSSLSYLRSFPFDKIKIDRCFVSDLSANADESLAILRAVASLGTSLGIATTAEGVETQEQMETVRAEGCTEVQGYFFSPPRPIEDIARLYLAKSEHPDAEASSRVA